MLRTMAEKYRPSSEDDTIGHDRNIKILKNFLLNKSFPHILFYEASETGKTCSKSWVMTIKWNASDNRGINSAREEIKGFAEKHANDMEIISLDGWANYSDPKD